MRRALILSLLLLSSAVHADETSGTANNIANIRTDIYSILGFLNNAYLHNSRGESLGGLENLPSYAYALMVALKPLFDSSSDGSISGVSSTDDFSATFNTIPVYGDDNWTGTAKTADWFTAMLYQSMYNNSSLSALGNSLYNIADHNEPFYDYWLDDGLTDLDKFFDTYNFSSSMLSPSIASSSFNFVNDAGIKSSYYFTQTYYENFPQWLRGQFMAVEYGLAQISQSLASIGSVALKPLFGQFLNSSSFSHSYSDIGFASNSVPSEVSLTYSGMDFFSAAIKLLSDGNKIDGSITRFLKHINDKMPKAKDTSEDESRIQSTIASASDVKDSLDSAFTFTTVEFRDVDDYFDSTTLLGQFDGAELPVSLSFTLPSFGGFGAQTFTVYTDSLIPFLNVSRAVFTLLYFVLLAGFVWYLFRVFFPLLVRFSTLLRSVLNW